MLGLLPLFILDLDLRLKPHPCRTQPQNSDSTFGNYFVIMFHIFFSERSGTGELGKSASFNPSMTRWQGVLCNWRMYPCLARVTDFSFLREAIAEMRNKEVVATGTLLNNGQQVLFVKYLRSYLTLTQRRSQAYRSARRLCGNMEPPSLALITPPSGD